MICHIWADQIYFETLDSFGDIRFPPKYFADLDLFGALLRNEKTRLLLGGPTHYFFYCKLLIHLVSYCCFIDIYFNDIYWPCQALFIRPIFT